MRAQRKNSETGYGRPQLARAESPGHPGSSKEDLPAKLTQQQIDDFNREDWLFLPELFSWEEVSHLAREAEGIYDT